MKRKEFMLGAVAGLAFAAAATAGGVIDWPAAHADPVAGASGRLVPSAGAAGLNFAPPQGAPLSFADIFQQVAPAVVQIDVKTRVPTPRQGFIQIFFDIDAREIETGLDNCMLLWLCPFVEKELHESSIDAIFMFRKNCHRIIRDIKVARGVGMSANDNEPCSAQSRHGGINRDLQTGNIKTCRRIHEQMYASIAAHVDCNKLGRIKRHSAFLDQ